MPAAKPVIVTIQSQLVFGCAGNSAAVPVLQSLGALVYPVPTVLLSNTPHYPTVGGQVLPASLIDDLLHVLLDRIEPCEIDGIITGYIGSSETAEVVAAFIDRVRARHAGVTVLCDPVIGDIDVGAYVEDRVAASLCEQLVPRADILTPNLFEARRILGSRDAGGLDCSIELLCSGAAVAVVTGITDKRNERVSTIASTARESWRVTTPRLDVRPTGTGDLFAAGFLSKWLTSRAPDKALACGVDIVIRRLEQCLQTGASELDPAMPPAEPPTYDADRIDRTARLDEQSRPVDALPDAAGPNTSMLSRHEKK